MIHYSAIIAKMLAMIAPGSGERALVAALPPVSGA